MRLSLLTVSHSVDAAVLCWAILPGRDTRPSPSIMHIDSLCSDRLETNCTSNIASVQRTYRVSELIYLQITFWGSRAFYL